MDQLYYDKYNNCFTIDVNEDEFSQYRFVAYSSDNGTGKLCEVHNCPLEDGSDGTLLFEYTQEDQQDWFTLMKKREDFFKGHGIDYVVKQDDYYTIAMTIPEDHYKKILDNINVMRACSCGDPNCGNTGHPKMLKRRA